MNSINIAIIGTQKSGTSSLHRYLASQPGFITHDSLEFPYFVNDDLYQLPYEEVCKEYFSEYSGEKIIAKSVGIVYEPDALARLHKHNPNVKIVITLRNPIDRAYSAFWYARRFGWEKEKSFEKAIWREETTDFWIGNRFCDYLNRSTYAPHIARVQSMFPKENVEVILTTDLRDNPAYVCNSILNKFGLPANVELGNEQRHYNRAAMPRSRFVSRMLTDKNPAKRWVKALLPTAIGRSIKSKIRTLNEEDFTPPPMRLDTRRRLRAYFLSHNESLGILLNKDFSEWNQ